MTPTRKKMEAGTQYVEFHTGYELLYCFVLFLLLLLLFYSFWYLVCFVPGICSKHTLYHTYIETVYAITIVTQGGV